jgi:hypothetical protein
VVSSSEELADAPVAHAPVASPAPPRAPDAVRPSPQVEARSEPPKPSPGAPVIAGKAASPAPALEPLRAGAQPIDEAAPPIPRARIAAPTAPARDVEPVVPIADPEARRPVRRAPPAAPATRSHARATPPRVPSVAGPIERDIAPALPGEPVAHRRAPAAPEHHSSRAPLRRAETRSPLRARRAVPTSASVVERGYEIDDPKHAPPPLPRRAQRRSEPVSVVMPAPEAIDPFERPSVFDDEQLDDELDPTAPVAPPSRIWLRGGRLRWVAGPAQLARADRTLSRLVRKRGRRL